MGLMRKTAVITPCYNEEGRLNPQAFVDKVGQNPALTFCFVNDGSTDGTAEVLENLCGANPERLRVLHLERNVGKAEAVRRGFLEAMKTDVAFIGFWDADLATPLSDIEWFVSTLEETGADIVVGARVKLKGRNIERKLGRHYLGRLFATVIFFALNETIYDTQCGAKIFRNTDDLAEVFGQPFYTRWIFDVEILARFALIAKRRGKTSLDGLLIELPLCEWKDVAGSKLRPIHFLEALIDTVILFIRYAPRIYASPPRNPPKARR